jgi:hypothetical protein
MKKFLGASHKPLKLSHFHRLTVLELIYIPLSYPVATNLNMTCSKISKSKTDGTDQNDRRPSRIL